MMLQANGDTVIFLKRKTLCFRRSSNRSRARDDVTKLSQGRHGSVTSGFYGEVAQNGDSFGTKSSTGHRPNSKQGVGNVRARGARPGALSASFAAAQSATGLFHHSARPLYRRIGERNRPA